MLDEDGTLVTSISDYDLRLMSQLQNFTLYGISVQEFISLVRPEKPSFLVSVGPDSKLGKFVFKWILLLLTFCASGYPSAVARSTRASRIHY